MRQEISPTKINENHNEKIRMYGKWFCKKRSDDNLATTFLYDYEWLA